VKYDRILICGSRSWRDYVTVKAKIEKYGHEDTVIIHGQATGADMFGEMAAKELQLDYMGFPARWKKEGKAAGPIRNKRMLVSIIGSLRMGLDKTYWRGTQCLVLAFHENIEKSKGTKHMLDLAEKHGIRAILVRESKLTDAIIDARTKVKK